MRRRTSTALIAAVAVFAGAAAAHAVPRKVVDVPTVPAASLQLDGRADDAGWRGAAVLDGFSVYRPTSGLQPAFVAEARVVQTTRALWFFVVVRLPREQVFGPLIPRDEGPTGDYVRIRLDVDDSARRANEFTVNAGGVLLDATVDDESSFDTAWDSLFDARTVIEEEQWTAEVRIPFSSLRFEPDRDVWAAQVDVRSWFHEQSVVWNPIDRESNNWLQYMGRLRGVSGHEPGRAIELLPSVTVGWLEDDQGRPPCDFGAGVGDFDVCGAAVDYGLGFKWGLTPSVTLDAVFNPDFSQIEADPGQLTVNNRFALFLSERRPFFLEGRQTFQTPLNVVYTRSINRPVAAVKLTGKAGPSSFGLLTAYDVEPPDSTVDNDLSPSLLETGDIIDATTAIARGTWDLGRNATLGLVVIEKDYVEGVLEGDEAKRRGFNTVGGGDYVLRLTPRWSFSGFAYGSATRSLAGDELKGDAERTELRFRTDRYRWVASHEHVARDFRSEAGFIPRVAYHRLLTKGDIDYRSDHPWATLLSPGIYTIYYLSPTADRVVERTFGANTLWQVAGRNSLFVVYDYNSELFEGRWFNTPVGHVTLSSDTLSWLSASTGATLARSLIRDPELRDEAEPAFVGYLYDPFASVEVRPTSSLSWLVSYQHRFLLREPTSGRLASQPIARSRGELFLSRDLSLRLVTQWDRFADRLTNDLLLGYQPSSGTVLFLGYREVESLEPLRLAERSVFLKISVLGAF